MIRNMLLSVHLLAIIVWIGVGFFELYLGRRLLASSGSPVEAPLIRIVYNSDLVAQKLRRGTDQSGRLQCCLHTYGLLS